MTLDQVTIVGTMTITVSYIIKIVGYPQQAYEIHKSKNIKNVSVFLYIISLLSYALWTYYGYLKNDWVVMWGQALGIVTTGLIVFFIYKYRHNR